MGYMVAVSRADAYGYPVYIGWTRKSVDQLLAQLQEGQPYPLEVLAVARATPFEMVKLAAILAQHSPLLCGNWYVRTPFLAELLERLSWSDRHVPASVYRSA